VGSKFAQLWVGGGAYLCCPVPPGSVADENMGRLLCEGVAHGAGRLKELADTREPMGGVQCYQVVLIRTGVCVCGGGGGGRV
jgi:hypothetical protein